MNSAGDVNGPSGFGRVSYDLRRWALANLRYAANLVLPPICLHCHAPVADYGVLCAPCWRGIDFITPPVCDRLGVPVPCADEEVVLSSAALRDPPLYDRARAVARFDGVMRNLIHGFKYSDRHEASEMLARLMGSAGAELIRDADILMPVPLHPKKLWTRRYNQAGILAQRIAELTDLPLDLSTLRRVKQTASQVGLNSQERRENVASAFAIRQGARKKVSGKRVLLIDDVITTGATLEGCAVVLKQAGAKGVDCLAVAMADYGAKS